MARLLPAFFLAFSLSCFAQADPHKLDSLRRSIDSSSRALQASLDSFSRRQDSLYNAAVRKGNPVQPRAAAGDPPVRQRSRGPALTPVLLALAAGVLAVIALVRRKKRKRGSS